MGHAAHAGGEGLRRLDRATAFERATREASDTLAERPTGDEPHWIAHFNEAELAGITGGRLLDLTRTDRHEQADDAAGIRSALGTRAGDAGRSRALDLVGVAECHFLLGDTGEAVEQTRRAVDAASLAKN